MFVEKEFQLSISRENLKLANFHSIDAIVALVQGESHGV